MATQSVSEFYAAVLAVISNPTVRAWASTELSTETFSGIIHDYLSYPDPEPEYIAHYITNVAQGCGVIPHVHNAVCGCEE